MTTAMVHYLLVFDHMRGELIREQPFDDSAEAIEAYAAAEREYEDRDYVEIVLVASDSIETIRLTHANYFAGFSVMSRFLGDIAV